MGRGGMSILKQQQILFFAHRIILDGLGQGTFKQLLATTIIDVNTS